MKRFWICRLEHPNGWHLHSLHLRNSCTLGYNTKMCAPHSRFMITCLAIYEIRSRQLIKKLSLDINWDMIFSIHLYLLQKLTSLLKPRRIYASIYYPIIGSDNGLSPIRRQAIIWTNAGLLLIGHQGTNFSEIWIEIPTFSFKKMCLTISSAKCRPFCLCLLYKGSTLEGLLCEIE